MENKNKKLFNGKIVILLLIVCVLIEIVALVMNKGSEFAGSDDAAEGVITEINPEYKAWLSPIMEPTGGEMESLLFCLQAALGAGVFGYGVGVLRERSRNSKAKEDNKLQIQEKIESKK